MTAIERSRTMKKPQKNQVVNRFFWSEKLKALPLTEQQREERVKRILLDAAERSKARRQEKVLKTLLKKAAKLKKAKTFKKVATKEVLEKKRDLVREGAEQLISELKKASRDGSFMDLLGMVSRKVKEKKHSPIVLEVLLERIRRNQWDKLSFEDQCLVIQAEASLGKHTN